MTSTLTDAGRTLERLRAVQANYDALLDLRRQAIAEALRAGNSLRGVASVARTSYESVRRMVEPAAAIFKWRGSTYVMTEHVTRVLEYKASGFARGEFAGDVADLGAGTAWLGDAGELGRELRRVHCGDNAPIKLNKQTAYALYQVLRKTMTGRPSRLADLYDDLRTEYAA